MFTHSICKFIIMKPTMVNFFALSLHFLVYEAYESSTIQEHLDEEITDLWLCNISSYNALWLSVQYLGLNIKRLTSLLSSNVTEWWSFWSLNILDISLCDIEKVTGIFVTYSHINRSQMVRIKNVLGPSNICWEVWVKNISL